MTPQDAIHDNAAVPRDTLIDFFDDLAVNRGEFLVHDDGYRSRGYRYSQIATAARAFDERLAESGLTKGDKVILWSENRPEWIVALWGCLLRGVILVPIDYRASLDLVLRVRRIVEARLVLVGEQVTPPPGEADVTVWRVHDAIAIPSRPPAKATGAARAQQPRQPARRDDVAEIIFTSGATAEPKGVVITHRNILANVMPVEREVKRYRRYGRLFFPIRFLNLLPLSHMFGQAMATFIPPMLPGVVVFMRGYNPAEIVRQIKTRRVSVLVSVPKILDVLRDHVLRTCPEVAEPRTAPRHWLVRWWRYRRVHRLFGWKFWSFVVGAAPLDPDLEAFWSRLGYLVIQGYGLTETAPIVTLNHPFRSRRGTVGKPIAGVEVKIAPDGEVLVRGENVTSGYYRAEAANAAAFESGWFHTGDIGAFDDDGRLLIRGRKKEMIVTPEGLNVFPEDVERVLDREPGVQESAVVGISRGGEERPHAVLVPEAGAEPAAIVRRANLELEDHQKIRGVSVWPTDSLPRTEGTRKLKRHEIQRWVAEGTPPAAQAPASGDTIASIVGRYAGGRTVAPETTLEELGLSSLERIEVMMALEERYRTTLDEASFGAASSVAELQRLIAQPDTAAAVPEPADFPLWAHGLGARTIRRLSLATWILPLARLFAWMRVDGVEHLRSLEGPVVFAANHQSHMDTPVILAALPPSRRYRTAVAMAREFFEAHFHPDRHPWRARLTSGLNYQLAALFFNAFPLPQREAGTRQVLRYMGELAEDGCSVLIFPEGRRTDHGEINQFRPGIGMIGARLGLPVVPVRIEGLDRVLHHSWHMARPGRVRVAFGAPIRMEGEDFVALTAGVREAVTRL